MKTFTFSTRLAAGIFAVTFLLSASVVFAAVQLSITKQQVKTLQATLTYQDIVNTPDLIPGDLSQKLVFISSLPPDTEILSAYMKHGGFTDTSSGGISAVLGIYDSANNVHVDGLSRGSIGGSPDIINEHDPLVRTPVFDRTDMKVMLLMTAPTNFSQITAGTLDVYINYLQH